MTETQYGLAETGILLAWETGAERRPLDRALTVLWAAGAGGDDPASLPFVERDRRLLAIRAETFGSAMAARALCPGCGAELEMELDSLALSEALPGDDDAQSAQARINSRDLAAVADLPAEEIAAALRARLAPAAFGEEAERIERAIEAQAQSAELSTRITCADCGASWTETLDVAGYVWAEVERAAMALLNEIAELAAAFGCSEAEILSLSPARRRIYLSMARHE